MMADPQFVEILESMECEPGTKLRLRIEKSDFGDGTSFRPETLHHLTDRIYAWIATRMIHAWEMRNEPPTLIEVDLDVTVV